MAQDEGYTAVSLRTVVHGFVLLLFSYNFFAPAYADSVLGEDHNHHRIDGLHGQRGFLGDVVDRAHDIIKNYEPSFLPFDQGILGKRRDEITSLANNAPDKSNIVSGDTNYYRFSSKELKGQASRRLTRLTPDSGDHADPGASGSQVYISINTCAQPDPSDQEAEIPPPQLNLYLSTSLSNQKPSATNRDLQVPLIEGAGSYNRSTPSELFLAVSAPSTAGFKGQYTYELTASIDDFYASYDQSIRLSSLDTDTNSTLLLTNDNTTTNTSSSEYRKWLTGPQPYSIFVFPQNFSKLRGLTHSFCGLNNWAPIKGNTLDDQNPAIKTSMIVFGGKSSQLRQQTFVGALNGSTTYNAVVALDGNTTAHGPGVIHGGGMVWSAIIFTTKSNQNCAILYNLSFCTNVAYAVPTNPKNQTLSNLTELGAIYDDYASNMYTNFSKSLAQIPCNTTASAQYSLARNCTDCDRAYKNWLCAVAIPRCQDFSSPDPFLLPRAIGQQFPLNGSIGTKDMNPIFGSKNMSVAYLSGSRNDIIDTAISPGPYKEVLPCKELCYDLIQSCPASLGFACPLKGHGLDLSYGHVQKGEAVTCNWPGRVWGENAAGRVSMGFWGWLLALVAIELALHAF